MNKLRSLLRWCLCPAVRFAWADWLEFSGTVRVCRCSVYPGFVAVEIDGLITQCTFMQPSEARAMAGELHAAAYQSAELIPVPESAAA